MKRYAILEVGDCLEDYEDRKCPYDYSCDECK